MKLFKTSVMVGLCMAVSGCIGEGGGGRVKDDKTIDYGYRKKHLSQLVAGVWVDPNGCDHWMIDDGIEGYLSQRLDQYGKPVCSGVAPPNTATGNYKGGQTINDPL
ncbi:MAG: hypothetical protein ACRBBT_08615 [Paracoccaceae bacterium]